MMLRSAVLACLLAVQGAVADQFDHEMLAEFSNQLRRALQGGGHNSPRGAEDLSICARPDSRNLVSGKTGTIHDDQTDEAVVRVFLLVSAFIASAEI